MVRRNRSLVVFIVSVCLALAGCWLLVAGTLARPETTSVAQASGPTKSGSALADQGKVGSWSCGDQPWVAGDRFGDGNGDIASLGGAFPGSDYQAFVRQDTVHRSYHVVLYAAANPDQGRVGGDLILDMPFSNIVPEQGTTYPTGRFDPIHAPTLAYQGNMLKIVVGLWSGGSGPDGGGRIYTYCSITPSNDGTH